MKITIDELELRNIIGEIVENEFKHIVDKQEEFNNEYDNLLNKSDEILREVKKNVSIDTWEKILEYDGIQGEIESKYQYRYWFKEGIKAGILNLEFLGKSSLIRAITTDL